MEDRLKPKILRTFKLSGIRNIIAVRMRESLDTAAQAVHVIEIDLSEIIKKREALIAEGHNVSITAMVIKAAALALRKTPELNSTLEHNVVSVYQDINIALAVALDNGLVTPVIRHADELNLAEINTQIRDLAERAKTGKLSMDDLSGGTFTVSNLGMYGVDQFTAIINPPQAGILAVGAIKKCPVVTENDEITARPVMKVTLTYDHRIIDGAPAAEYLAAFKDICTNQAYMLG